MNKPNNKNNPKSAFFSLKLLNEKLKNYDVFFTYQEEEGGNVFGTYKGVKKMSQSSKKITNQDIMNLLTKKFEAIDKRFEDMKKDINKINAKIDLMIQTPTMNKEIDHEALAKINAR